MNFFKKLFLLYSNNINHKKATQLQQKHKKEITEKDDKLKSLAKKLQRLRNSYLSFIVISSPFPIGNVMVLSFEFSLR